MAWVERRRQQRELQATQTQQGVHSVLEARGLFFTFPMVGMCLVWIFQIGPEQLEFQLSFSPARLPFLLCDAGFVQEHCFGMRTAERSSCNERARGSPQSCIPAHHEGCALGCGAGCALAAQGAVQRLE